MSRKNLKVQVEKDHYENKYDSMSRFISYFHQIDLIFKSGNNKVLEIGVGNKTVSNYLRQQKINLTTCDFDKRLGPDFVADVRKLPFDDAEFETVVAFEVLEHLPFKDFEIALKELKRVSSDKVIISIPYSCLCFSTTIYYYFPPFKKRFSILISIPRFFQKIAITSKNKEHYWELGRRNYSKKRIRNVLLKYFDIERSFSGELVPTHYFYVLSKKKEQ